MMNTTDLVIYPDSAVYLALVCSICFIVIGVVGNALTLIALSCHHKLRQSVPSVFVVSLCITDLLFCCFNLPITVIRYTYRAWVLGPAMCRLFPFFFYLNVAASLFIICFLTINRYIIIAHYQHYTSLFRRSRLTLMLTFCWLFPACLLLPTLLDSWGKFGLNQATFSCTVLRDSNGHSPKKFFFLFGFSLPCSVILLAYCRIWMVVRSSGKAVQRKNFDQKLTGMILIIFVAFFMCYLPLMLVNVFDDDNRLPFVHVLASILAWSASIINPFIYGFMSSRYRQAYLALLPDCLHLNSIVTSAKNSSCPSTTNSSVIMNSLRN